MKKDKLVLLGDSLESCMDVIAELKEQLKPYEEQEERLRSEIVKGLLSKGLDFVKCTSGLSFGMVKGRVSYKVKKGEEAKAIQWAIKEYPSILSIGAANLNKVAAPMLNPPEFIERTEGEPHLAVRS